MKNLVCFAIIGLISFSCLAQGEMSEKQFEELPKAQKKLYLRVKKANSLTNNRINDYLYVNGEEKRVVKENSTVFVLTDVVNSKPIYTTTDNVNAAKATETDHLQVGGDMGLDLDGAGITVRVWDGGAIQSTHSEFENLDNTASRITNVEFTNTEGTLDLDTHATHVTGTISAKGVNPTAKGMATAVLTRNYNFNNDSVEMVSEANNVTSDMILSNHSYGVPINQAGGTQLDPWFIGAYTDAAVQVDDIARNNPQYLIVASAGNSGGVSYPGGLATGFDKLTGNKTAKNNLVIANASPTINPFTNDVTFQINASSSRGPTDDLRIKPDIAGDGTGLVSTAPGDGYTTLTGTSMSAPNVTGSLALLQQYYNQIHGKYMNASTLKALVCHTATDDDNTIGPDPVFGWGLLNAKRSAEVITEENINTAIINELTLNDQTTYVLNFEVQAGNKLSATICWTDIRGLAATSISDLNNPMPRLINDLDIRITKDGVTYLPWKLDYTGFSFSNSKGDNIVDNIERIDIDVPEAGNYSLVVSHKGTIVADGPFDPKIQNFSLILTGANLSLGVDENSLSKNLIVFPNPNKGEFIVRFNSNITNANDKVKIDIYDLSGRLVYNKTFSNTLSMFNETIRVDDIKTGVYIANISDGNNSASHKLIIE